MKEPREEQSDYPRSNIPRYGVFSFMHEDKFYVLGGSRLAHPLLECFDSRSGWRSVPLRGEDLPTQWTGIQGCLVDECLFVYGGFCGRSVPDCGRYNELRKINLESHHLETVRVKDSISYPMRKDKYGCVAFENKIYVFGGYGKPSRQSQKDANFLADKDWLGWSDLGWTNEFHALDVNNPEWMPVETSGCRPPPCAAFSFTKIDPHRIVLFGGRQRLQRVNDIYVFDLSCMTWKGPVMPTFDHELWPIPRSFHSAIALQDPSKLLADQEPKLLVLWGMDQDAEPINDAWILDVVSMKWEKVDCIPTGPRVWHTASTQYNRDGTQVYIFGGSKCNLFQGGDNIVSLSHLLILQYGVPSLSYTVMRFIIEHWQVMEKHLIVLPSALKLIITEYKSLKSAQHRINQSSIQHF